MALAQSLELSLEIALEILQRGNIDNMARRKLEEHNTRKLFRVGRGHTMAVTLPIALVRELGWREKQRVVVTKRGNRLIIEDWQE